MNIFLIAMEEEFKNLFEFTTYSEIGGQVFKTFEIENSEDIVVITGIGKVNAAAATQFVLDNYKEFNSIINIGACGGITKEVEIGTSYAVEKVSFFDVDVTGFGSNYKIGQIPGNGLTVYKLDSGSALPKRTCISGDSFISDLSKIQDYIDEYSPTLVEMELGAIAHVLHINNKLDKLIAIKGVTDKADGDAHGDFQENLKLTTSNLSKYIQDEIFIQN